MQINLVNNTETPSLEHHSNILPADLDKIPPNICTSVILNNTLNYLTHEQLVSLFGKIRHNGSITINSLDAMETARAMYLGEINVQQLSSLTTNHLTQHSLLEIKNLFEQHGYTIEIANIDNLTFYIKAKRP